MPASRLPIITESAPAAIALVMSPENLMPPSAISGTRAFAAGARAFGNRRDLRNARAGYHARGADRARTDAHLDAVHAQRNQFPGALVGGHVAGDQLHFGQLALDGLRRPPARGCYGRARCRWRARPPCAPPVPGRAPENRPWRRWPRPPADAPGYPWPNWGTSASSECP